jgi:hypothetical protein
VTVLKPMLKAADAMGRFGWSLYVLVWKSVALLVAGVLVAFVLILLLVLLTGGGLGDR